MIAGALQFTTAKTSDIMTGIEKVQILTLDTILSHTTLENIRRIGFSRIPVSFTADKKTIFGILLAKSLVGYNVKNQTIRKAIMENVISVRVPLFFTENSKMSEVCRAFKEGQSHMGLVCGSSEAARDKRNLADQMTSCLSAGNNFEPS